jgi:hypothetical protein
MRRGDDDDDGVVADGETVSVRVNLTDTVRFDEDGRERFLRMADDNMMDANTFDVADHQPGFRFAPRAQRQSVCDARDEMIRRAENAWRTPVGDAAQPDNSSPPEVMQRHLRTEPDGNAQRKRDAWADYRDRLGSAWRTNPQRASAVEAQLERTRGGGK